MKLIHSVVCMLYSYEIVNASNLYEKYMTTYLFKPITKDLFSDWEKNS